MKSGIRDALRTERRERNAADHAALLESWYAENPPPKEGEAWITILRSEITDAERHQLSWWKLLRDVLEETSPLRGV